jgi:hypothetical protein
MGMSPYEFYDMTFAEYQYKIQGFRNHEMSITWLNAIMIAKAVWASKKDPYPTLEEFMNPKESPPELTDEEIFDLAKKQGIEVPEGR